MIRSLRWRLQIWYTCLLLLVVGGFGSILYFQTRASKLHEFDVQLESHRAIVFKVAGTYCRHPDDRDDLVQEIAAQLWRAWPG